MTHRGVNISRERGPLRRIARDLAFLAILAAVGSVLFIVGDLLVYGTVRW